MPKNKYTIFSLLSCASLLLIACSVNMIPPNKKLISTEWHPHQQLLSKLNHYEARGMLAYFSSKRTIYLRFNWRQTNKNNYQIILTNLLGGTEINLNVQMGVAKLINNQGECYVSKVHEIMIQKFIGVPITLENLRYWILGLPGDVTNFTVDYRGYLHTLHYNNIGQYWTITYQDYLDNIKPALPLNIELKQNNNLIKLKINSWKLYDTTMASPS